MLWDRVSRTEICAQDFKPGGRIKGLGGGVLLLLLLLPSRYLSSWHTKKKTSHALLIRMLLKHALQIARLYRSEWEDIKSNPTPGWKEPLNYVEVGRRCWTAESAHTRSCMHEKSRPAKLKKAIPFSGNPSMCPCNKRKSLSSTGANYKSWLKRVGRHGSQSEQDAYRRTQCTVTQCEETNTQSNKRHSRTQSQDERGRAREGWARGQHAHPLGKGSSRLAEMDQL